MCAPLFLETFCEFLRVLTPYDYDSLFLRNYVSASSQNLVYLPTIVKVYLTLFISVHLLNLS